MQLPNQMPEPPVHMAMSPYYPYILAISIAIFCAATAYAARDAKRTGRWLPLLVIAGAAIASFQECIYDVAVLVWWAELDTTPMYRIFNRSVPLWMVFAYPWFIGGMGYWAYRHFQDGMRSATLWKLYFFGWFANLLLEVPALQIGDIYTYYGEQPFKILGFPIWMAMTNTLMPIFVGAALHALDDVLRGPRALLTLVLVPAATASAEIASGWPIWLALNSGQGLWLTQAATLVTLGFSMSLAYLISLKLCVEAPATGRVGATPAATKVQFAS
ncbi:hypothetical protein [Novosphingobium sp. 9U]|uniref:hypothetical protein n=1 Tax=Novosphingobium sp. 9U TaxID=2653158 RepID=UPI0012F43BA0|nr:hypothetical protein [Novosphingobium sp. 9U]VWX50198.1 conserved membrane hypothetical protein [Novosphingobium sp. 9U]